MQNHIVNLLPPKDITPIKKKGPKLNDERNSKTYIPPRLVFHPAIINASDAMFAKIPSQKKHRIQAI